MALGCKSICRVLLDYFEGHVHRQQLASRSVNCSERGCFVSACGRLGKCRRAGDLWSDERAALIKLVEGIDCHAQ